MSILTFIDIGLSALVITVAASTIFMRELFAAVVSYVAYGLLLAFVNLLEADEGGTEP